jgi:hypothetical protein
VATDWVDWHRGYDQDTPLRRRLALVQRYIGDALSAAGPDEIRVISMCAGEGRDLLGVLQEHPARKRVHARLVELNPELAAVARDTASEAGLEGVEVVVGDAGTTDAYIGAVPANLVLVCGVFGNITDADIEGTIRALPGLCAPKATVIWTRHCRPPDLTPAIRNWVRAAGFSEVAWEVVSDSQSTVGAARLDVPPPPFQPNVRLFSFIDRG